MAQDQYQAFAEHLRRIADLESSIAVLSWDKEVNMPPRGARFRSRQLATLAGLQFDLLKDPALGDLLEALSADGSNLDKRERRNVELTRRDRDRQLRLDQAFVIRRSEATSRAYHAWLAAREANDFERFREPLEAMVTLKQEEAERMGYDRHPYDALLEEFEPGCTVAQLDALFAGLRGPLGALVQGIADRPQVDDSFLRRRFPKDRQWRWGLALLDILQFDQERGRQDVSPHPFTINFSAEDVRVTTRIDENDLANLTWSCIHEIGHALYEQGLPSDQYGLPLGRNLSLGIHESQSRLWENHVGRSRAFWAVFLPTLKSYFPGTLDDIDLDTFYRGVNKVHPSLIRTESDELHYHLHILIRYELEKALITGDLPVADLPAAWREKYRTYLDLGIPDDRQGILQDIHWAHGSIGYFPTYTLGSLYAAQFFERAAQDIPGLRQSVGRQELAELRRWLERHIHVHGRFYTAEDLCTQLTGRPLSPEPFLEYAARKFEDIYRMV